MTTFRTEFPDFPETDFPVLPEGFSDSSWRNDACPSMKNETLGLFVFVDYADVSKREHNEGLRFAVARMDNDGCLENFDTLLTTDDWAEVLALIDSKRVAS